MRKLYILFLLMFLNACNVGEDYKIKNFVSYMDTKQTLNIEHSEEKISPLWFEILQDNDLNTLVQKAKENNLTLAQSKEKLLQARYSFLIKTKDNLPMFDANFEYDFNKTNNSRDIYNNNDFFRTGFDVSWEIDLWGKNKNVSKQYYELINKAKYSLADTLVSIESEVVNNFISLRAEQEKLRIAKQNIELQKNILDIVKNKYNVGIEDELALNQAEYLLEKTKSTIPSLEANIENYKNAISILIGKTPNNIGVNLDKFKQNIAAKTFKYNVQKLYKLPLDIVRTRPDVKVAETEIKAQNAYLNQAIINLYPSISLEASFGFLSSRGSNLFNTDNQIYGYNPMINIPVWQWGKLTNNVELQKHIKEEYILNYNEVMITALMEIKNSIYNVEKAYKKCSFISNSLNKMRNVLKITKNKYENGLVDFVDLANSEQNVLDIENSYIEANVLILQSITSFYKATGGGYNFR